ncbi:MAG: DUF2513 domain-containing protein [Oscillospiraceae bacterium]
MRLNADCVRVVILTIENNLGFGKIMRFSELMSYPLVQSFTRDDVEYSLQQLTAENMIDCKIRRYLGNNFDYSIMDVTPEGHKLCDSLRNDSFWEKIKPQLTDVSTVGTLLSAAVSMAASLMH